MKRILTICLVSLLAFTSCDVVKSIYSEPSESDVLYALTKLMDSSALKAITKMKAVNDKGIGGLLPEELQPVLAGLQATGAIKDLDKVEGTLKNVSGVVVSESGDLMKDAIRQVKFKDAVSIVLGGKDAATAVLKQAMYTSVKQRYSEKISAELTKADPSIEQYWPAAAGTYNLFAKKKVDSNLSDFIAERSVDLLFSSMGAEEGKYRDNIPSVGDQVVSKVFDFYRNRQNGGENQIGGIKF